MKKEIEENITILPNTQSHTFQVLYFHFYIIYSHYEIISAFFSPKQGTEKNISDNGNDFLKVTSIPISEKN